MRCATVQSEIEPNHLRTDKITMCNQRPIVSVLIVTYASEDTIESCLSSALESAGHLGGQVEFIVVDNASPDNTARIVEVKFPSVRLIRCDENIGYARAVNFGLRESSGKYVLILNADCILTADALPVLLSFAESNKRVGIVGPMLLNRDGTLQPSGRRAQGAIHILLSLMGMRGAVETSLLGRGRNFLVPMDVEEVSGAAMFCRREVLMAVGGMDERFFLYFEDVDLCMRVRGLGWRIVYCPMARIVHLHGHSTSKAASLARGAFFGSACTYLRKHHGSLAVIVFKLISTLRECLLAFVTLLSCRVGKAKDHIALLRLILSS